MTNEEAVKHIMPRLKFYIQCTDDNIALHKAVKALEKQIPKKLIHITRNEHCEKVIGYGCPACKTDVTGSGFYCWKCGQALDWREEK